MQMLFNKNYLSTSLLLSVLTISLSASNCNCRKNHAKKPISSPTTLMLEVSPTSLSGDSRTMVATLKSANNKKPVDLNRYKLHIGFTQVGGTGSNLECLVNSKSTKTIISEVQESVKHFSPNSSPNLGETPLQLTFRLAPGIDVTSVTIEFKLLDPTNQVLQIFPVNWKAAPPTPPQLNISKLFYDPTSRQLIYDIYNAGKEEAQNVQIRYININDEVAGKKALLDHKSQDTITLGKIGARSSLGEQRLTIDYQGASEATFKFEVVQNGTIYATKQVYFSSHMPSLRLIPKAIFSVGKDPKIEFKIKKNDGLEVDIDKLSLLITKPLENPAAILHKGNQITTLKGAELDVTGKDISLDIHPGIAKKASFTLQLLYENIPIGNPQTFQWENKLDPANVAIHSAIMAYDLAALRQAIEQGEKSLNFMNKCDDTILQELSYFWCSPHATGPIITPQDIAFKQQAINLVISKGFNVNATDMLGQTALHAAAYSYQGEPVAVLVANGANVNAKDMNGNTPLHLAAEALNLNPESVLSQFLKISNIDINAQNEDGNTPLHLAILQEKRLLVKIIQLLLEHGAKQDIPNNSQETPLDLARKSDNKAIKELFGV